MILIQKGWFTKRLVESEADIKFLPADPEGDHLQDFHRSHSRTLKWERPWVRAPTDLSIPGSPWSEAGRLRSLVFVNSWGALARC